MKALSSNRIATSPHYGKILAEYNDQLAKNGRVNNKKFFELVVSPLVPDYSLQAWYQFVNKFRTTAGLVAANVGVAPRSDPALEESKLENTMMTIQQATSLGIQRALNIGAARLKQIMENPELMTAKEAADLLFKGMKAQDSRIHAVGKIREDNREQEKFDRAFDAASYGE